MPKIKVDEEEFEEEDDELIEGEEEEDEDWDVRRGRIPEREAKPQEREQRQERQETRGRKPKPKEIKRRFGIMAPQPLRIVDTETNEVIGEGEPAIIQALTDILERLERIEVQIGALG